MIAHRGDFHILLPSRMGLKSDQIIVGLDTSITSVPLLHQYLAPRQLLWIERFVVEFLFTFILWKSVEYIPAPWTPVSMGKGSTSLYSMRYVSMVFSNRALPIETIFYINFLIEVKVLNIPTSTSCVCFLKFIKLWFYIFKVLYK